MTVAPRAAARLSVPTATGSCALSARARSTWRTVAQALPGERPAFSNPWSRIDPILPSPSTATGSSVITASSQAFLEQGRRVGFLVAVLDDHRSVERETPAGGRRTGYGPRAGHDDRPGGNLERSLAGPSIRLLPHHLVHGPRAREDRARSEHGSLAHDRALVDPAPPAHQHIVFHDHGEGADRLQHTPDLRRRRQVHALPDLPTRPAEPVTVDPRAFVHVRSDIHVHRRHAHDAGRYVGAVANARAAGHDAHPVGERGGPQG